MLSEEIKSLKGLNSSIVEGLIQIADIEYERILISYDKLLEFIELIKENNCIIFTGNTYVDYEGDLTQYIEEKAFGLCLSLYWIILMRMNGVKEAVNILLKL